ncbi:MAG TPA: hypothetical protein PLJ27_07065 [Polyangiaceae bacterium]|nr:hypothetical protein [Polyangiaceae bacterium]
MIRKRSNVAVLGYVAISATLAVSSALGQQPPQPQPPAPKHPPAGPVQPPPLNVDYLQFGTALHVQFSLNPGPVCPSHARVPCILGSGAGLVARAGYRSRGPWYIGGAYSLAKLDTQGLMRLGVLQQLGGEMRYLLDFGLRTEPYLTAGLGGLAFGNEWHAEAWGLASFGGAGFEVQLSRTTIVGLAATYRPMLFFEWTDRAGQHRDTGVAHFWGLALTLEAREPLGSHGMRLR